MNVFLQNAALQNDLKNEQKLDESLIYITTGCKNYSNKIQIDLIDAGGASTSSLFYYRDSKNFRTIKGQKIKGLFALFNIKHKQLATSKKILITNSIYEAGVFCRAGFAVALAPSPNMLYSTAITLKKNFENIDPVLVGINHEESLASISNDSFAQATPCPTRGGEQWVNVENNDIGIKQEIEQNTTRPAPKHLNEALSYLNESHEVKGEDIILPLVDVDQNIRSYCTYYKKHDRYYSEKGSNTKSLFALMGCSFDDIEQKEKIIVSSSLTDGGAFVRAGYAVVLAANCYQVYAIANTIKKAFQLTGEVFIAARNTPDEVKGAANSSYLWALPPMQISSENLQKDDLAKVAHALNSPDKFSIMTLANRLKTPCEASKEKIIIHLINEKNEVIIAPEYNSKGERYGYISSFTKPCFALFNIEREQLFNDYGLEYTFTTTDIKKAFLLANAGLKVVFAEKDITDLLRQSSKKIKLMDVDSCHWKITTAINPVSWIQVEHEAHDFEQAISENIQDMIFSFGAIMQLDAKDPLRKYADKKAHQGRELLFHVTLEEFEQDSEEDLQFHPMTRANVKNYVIDNFHQRDERRKSIHRISDEKKKQCTVKTIQRGFELSSLVENKAPATNSGERGSFALFGANLNEIKKAEQVVVVTSDFQNAGLIALGGYIVALSINESEMLQTANNLAEFIGHEAVVVAFGDDAYIVQPKGTRIHKPKEVSTKNSISEYSDLLFTPYQINEMQLIFDLINTHGDKICEGTMQIKNEFDAIIVTAGVGFGKTELLVKWFKYWLDNPNLIGKVLYTVNSILLSMQAHDRLHSDGRIISYQDFHPLTDKHAKGGTICVVSLGKKKFQEMVDQATIFAVDEITQVLNILVSKECGSGEAYDKLIDILGEIATIKQAPSVLLDAQANDLVIDIVQDAVKKKTGREARILVLEAEPLVKNRQYTWHYSPEQGDMLGLIFSKTISNMRRKEPTVIMLESAAAAMTMEKMLYNSNQDLKILTLTQETKSRDEYEVFSNDPSGSTLGLDILIYSPLLNAGVSIEHLYDYFKHFYFGGNGSQVGSCVAFQMIGRVRYHKTCEIFIDSLPIPMHEYAAAKHCRLGAAKGLEMLAERIGRPQKVEEFSEMKMHIANENYKSKLDMPLYLWREIEHNQGINLRAKDIIDDDIKEAAAEYKLTKKVLKEEYRMLVLKAPCIDKDEAKELSNKDSLCLEDAAKLERYQIARAFLVENETVNGNHFDLWDRGYGSKQIKRHAMMMTGEHYQDNESEYLSIQTFNQAEAHHLQSINALVGLNDETVITNEIAEDVLDYCLADANRFELVQLQLIESRFGVFDDGSKKAKKNLKRPTKRAKDFARKLLEKTGHKFSSEQQTGLSREKRKNAPRILQIDADRFKFIKDIAERKAAHMREIRERTIQQKND